MCEFTEFCGVTPAVSHLAQLCVLLEPLQHSLVVLLGQLVQDVWVLAHVGRKG